MGYPRRSVILMYFTIRLGFCCCLVSCIWSSVRHDWATSLSLFTFHFHALEKEMATHSSVLAWRIPGRGEPGGLPSMALHRHNWSDLAAAAAGCADFRYKRFMVNSEVTLSYQEARLTLICRIPTCCIGLFLWVEFDWILHQNCV